MTSGPILDATDGRGPFSAELGHRTVTAADVVLFGGATGDYARMHFDHGLAPTIDDGPRPIVHGLLSACFSVGALAFWAPDVLAQDDPDAWIAGCAFRLERPLHQGDRLSVRHRPAIEPAVAGLTTTRGLDTEFETLNQRGERIARGTVSIRFAPDPIASVRPEGMAPPVWQRGGGPRPLFAEDLIEFGPRGEGIGRTIGEADVVGFTNLTADRSPLYLQRVFAAGGRFGGCVVPPLFVFALAFGEFLRDLLAAELPSTGLAGHLGDQLRNHAPVRIGDTIRTRHRPLRATPSRGRRDMSVVHFELQVLNQRDELVQDGEVAMWIPNRAARSGGAS